MSDIPRVLLAAADHPWYRNEARGCRLDQWPILRKSELYERIARASRDRSNARGVYYSRSGGTNSGAPRFFPADVAENHRQRKLLARHLLTDRVFTPETIAMNVLPIVRMYRAMEIFTELCERCGGTSLPMAAVAGDAEILETAAALSANTLVGMPSRLIALARFAGEAKATWRAESVVFGGEFLQPGKRRLLAEALGARRFTGVYGSAELGVFAWHADIPEIPTYHFPRDIVHVEIARPDAEGYGAIVVTNVVRERFPLIRYETGDVGRLVAATGDRVTIELRGRDAETFLIGDNYHALRDFADVFDRFIEHQIQIRFDEALRQDVIRFLLVPRPGDAGDALERWAADRIQDILECHPLMYRTEVTLVPSERLVRTPAAAKTPALIDYRGR